MLKFLLNIIWFLPCFFLAYIFTFLAMWTTYMFLYVSTRNEEVFESKLDAAKVVICRPITALLNRML